MIWYSLPIHIYLNFYVLNCFLFHRDYCDRPDYYDVFYDPYKKGLNSDSKNPPLSFENPYEDDFEIMKSMGLPTTFGKVRITNSYIFCVYNLFLVMQIHIIRRFIYKTWNHENSTFFPIKWYIYIYQRACLSVHSNILRYFTDQNQI